MKMVTYLKFKMQFAVYLRERQKIKHFLKKEKAIKYDCLNSLILSVITKRFAIHFQCIKLSCSTAPFRN